jgi:hypothetical protein
MSLNLGLFFIGFGFLLKAFPDLIAGYNTMTKEQKANVDIRGLSTFMRNVLIVIGLVIIAGNFLLRLVGFPLIASSLTFVVPFVGIAFLLVKAQKFDHNNQGSKSKMTYFVLGFVVLSVLGLLYYGTTPAKIEINGASIHITGMYGIELTGSDIQEITMREKLPSIIKRTNGFSFGSSNKGNFKLEEFGKCKLFLQSDNGPYLVLIEKNGEKIILNRKNKTEAEKVFENIKTLINK